jgi:hypothetical protein
MPDEIVEQKPVEENKPAETKEPTPPAEAKNTDHMIPKSRLDEEIQKRKDLEKQAKEAAKRLEEFETKEKERQQAELTEAERTQQRLKELESQNAEKDQLLKARELQDTRNKIAKAVAKELGVSLETAEGLASRLQGTTEEEITEDAKIVFALLPKQEAEKKPAPKLDPTNPGGGKQGETRLQTKARLGLGQTVNPWDKGSAADRGGGVVVISE